MRRALSVRQPWAWLIVNGQKPVENRTWRTTYRGQLYIHASQKFDREGYEWVRANFPSIDMPYVDAFGLGCLVGRVRLVDCVTEHPSAWFFGPFGFVFEDAAQLPTFKPMRGALGIFQFNEDTR